MDFLRTGFYVLILVAVVTVVLFELGLMPTIASIVPTHEEIENGISVFDRNLDIIRDSNFLILHLRDSNFLILPSKLVIDENYCDFVLHDANKNLVLKEVECDCAKDGCLSYCFECMEVDK